MALSLEATNFLLIYAKNKPVLHKCAQGSGSLKVAAAWWKAAVVPQDIKNEPVHTHGSVHRVVQGGSDSGRQRQYRVVKMSCAGSARPWRRPCSSALELLMH
ncbi:hypothetical protein GGX14DRAFT_401168 [Mycena pura]|uniref:Uncharacterized protein n=1 Tax=Mycena pura TaxID=153505 RepID=A0AAD6V1E7_9AGAR|nr:hypothetical protein GGX14DRAFT_401168 [Mycena pura]